MQLGIKVKVIPCNTPGYMWYANHVQQSLSSGMVKWLDIKQSNCTMKN